MTNTTKYWIWLSQAIGYNNPKQKRLFDLYSDISQFYFGREKEWISCGFFTKKELDGLSKYDVASALGIIAKCNAYNYNIVSFDDTAYPKKLMDIYAPPCVLYMQGQLIDVDTQLSIAMVGTRKATQYGVKAAHVIAHNLSKSGVIVISGGAVGIDSASHIGALEGGGVTLCVLGCGINYNYLSQNAAMRKNITVKGAIISEYPPDTPSAAYNFPARNRLISGLSDGVLVVEADEKSGSLITVSHAAEQGRDVFAVMGNINSRYSIGTNKLIKDGAIPVTSFKDIIENYPSYKIEYPEAEQNFESNSAENKEKIPVHREDIGDLSDDAKAVYHIINAKPVHIDMICERSGLPVHKVLRAVTELEISGLINSLQGRQYILV